MQMLPRPGCQGCPSFPAAIPQMVAGAAGLHLTSLVLPGPEALLQSGEAGQVRLIECCSWKP